MPPKNKLKINVRPEELSEKFRELLWIMYRVRETKQDFDEYYGVEKKKAMKLWEAKADTFLEEVIIKENDT